MPGVRILANGNLYSRVSRQERCNAGRHQIDAKRVCSANSQVSGELMSRPFYQTDAAVDLVQSARYARQEQLTRFGHDYSLSGPLK